MQNPFQDNLRKPWLLLCTTLLVLDAVMPVEHETLFFSAASSALVEAVMFLLSFPLGTAAVFPFHSPYLGMNGRFVFWAAAMGLGYAQWFHIFPALLRRMHARPTALNLSAASGVAPRSTLGLGAARPHALDDPASPPVPQFNERGMTPLERVFRDEE